MPLNDAGTGKKFVRTKLPAAPTRTVPRPVPKFARTAQPVARGKQMDLDRQARRSGKGARQLANLTDRIEKAAAHARAAKAGRPYDLQLVRDAVRWQLPAAKNIRIVEGKGSVHGSSMHGPVEVKHPRKFQLDAYSYPEPKTGHDPRMERSGLDKTVSAPVVKILEQTARVSHGISGLATAGPHGLTEGLVHNKPYSFGKLLKSKGVPAGIAGAVGFGLDVGLDPTTYVTGGASSVARGAAEKAAVKGVTLKFAGHELPAVTRSTALLGRGVKTVASHSPTRLRNAAAGVKDVARDVRPQMRPAGTSETEFKAARHAGRQARAEARRGESEATQHARGLKDRIKPDEMPHVVDAIERGGIHKLPAHLQEPARFVRTQMREAKTLREKHGISEGDVTKSTAEGAAKHYFPHEIEKDLKEGGGSNGHVGRTVRLPSSKERKDKRPISAQNPERIAAGKVPHSTNVPLVFANYKADTARAVSRAKLHQALADAGRPLEEGMDLHEGDAVWHLKGSDLAEVKDPREITEAAAKTGEKHDRYFVMNRRIVEQQTSGVTPQAQRSPTGAAIDRGTSAFKRVATFTPGFHARNVVGDTQMAYLAQPGHRIPGNATASARALKRLSEVERAQRETLGKVKPTTATVKVAGKKVGIDEFLAGATEHGVIRSGYIGRELEELKGVGKGIKSVRARTSSAHLSPKRWMQNREDWMRLATYKHGLDTGMTPAEAADLSLSTHIDYGDLTHVERAYLRRAFPFYTFSARALPIHAKALVTKPGKFANIEKAREETSTATGLDLGDEQKKLKTYQARQAPLIMRISGKPTVISDALPLTLLNEIPTSKDPGKSLNELSQWVAGMLTPLVKDPAEIYANRSFFFRSDIQNKDRPLVAAPGWAAQLYKRDRGLAKKLGIVPDYVDKRTGRKVAGWNGRTDYIFKAVPGLPNLLQQLTTQGANRRGQGTGQKALGALLGVKAEPLDPEGAMLEVLFTGLDDVTGKLGALNQQGVKAANATAEYRRLSAQQKQIKETITRLSRERGDAVPLFDSSKGKGRHRSAPAGFGAGSGGGFTTGSGRGGF